MLKNSIYTREKILKHIKYKSKDGEAKHLVKYKKEKDYEYYICDYCEGEIEILDKKTEMSGGVVLLPASLTQKDPLKLVLCNKCLKPVLKEFEDKLNNKIDRIVYRR